MEQYAPVRRLISYMPCKARLLIVMAASVLMSCANPSTLVLTNFGKPFHAVDPDSVRITTEVFSTPPYMEIGYLYLEEAKLEDVVRLSRKRAGEVGGEAIMNARVGVSVTQVGNILTFPIYDRSYFVRGIIVKRKAGP
jgi:hypothetical protein